MSGMPMVTSKDIENVVAKLSSDKAKTREEGVNLLNNWLNGDSSASFCQYLSRNTEKLKPNRVPGANTWPFLVTLLMRCVSLEVFTSKRHAPKLIYAKALRNVVKKADDYSISGKPSLLLSVVNSLYGHIWETLKEVQSFELDYGSILRCLMAKKEYRFGMRKKVYCSLVLLYLEKVGGISCEVSSSQCHLTDKVFQTLHSLLKNPPGDFPSSLREPTVQGFIEVFSNLRGDGKYLCKLLECLNTYLFQDGPNLGSQSLDIHDSVQHLVFRCWLTTSEQSSKDILVHYARLQLNLTKYSDGNRLVEQIMDVVIRELDQSNYSSVGLPRKLTRNDFFESLNNSQYCLVELAALVFYKACVGSYRTSSSHKRVKKESATTQMKERLAEGKWLWNAVLCCLARKYGNRISTDLFIYWFENICKNFERILNTANMEHSYDGLFWTLGSLHEFASMFHFTAREELHNQMHSLWSRVLHALPTFSSVTTIVDAALGLLGKMLSNDVKNSYFVPQDTWDLQVFKQIPSVSLLFFITSYFSRRGSHGDHRDTLYLRQNLLRSISCHLRRKDWSKMDNRMVSLVPAATYALCGGFLIPYTADGTPKPYNHALEQENDEIFECSVETIAKLEIMSCDSASQSFHHQNVRLPRQIKDSLLSEAESDFIKSLEDIEIESMDLVEVFFTSAFVSKYLYFSYRTRAKDGHPLLLTKSIQLVSKLLDRATSLFQEDINDACLNSYPGASNNYNVLCSAVEPLRTFLSSPLFDYLRDQDIITNSGIRKSLEKLLRTMVNLFKEYSSCFINVQSETMQVDLSSSDSSKQTSISCGNGKSRIVDVELDASEASKNGSTLLSSNMILRRKLEILQLVSSFFTALPAVTWEILFDLMRKEIEHQVCDKILSCLCQHPQGASSAQLTDLVNSIKDAVETRVRAKLPCSDLITASCNFLGASQPQFADEKVTHQPSKETDIEQNLKCFADIVDNLAESNLLDWTDRIKVIGCLCNIIALSPPVGQIVIGRLLTFLRDPDYRVRIFLARKIGILFRTWDGHTELYHDIRANFGVKLVSCSQENLITAQEALAAGPPPMTTMETIVMTLIHIALHSDKMELEAVFMTCAAAAIDPGLRELIMAALDNLSSNLHYSSRAKYFEELMGQILFCWVTCGMDFAALVGIRDLFVARVEPKYFIQYCCHWILPALVITVDTPNLKWIASVACEPLGILVRTHFVPIFSVCMAMHCSKKPGWEKGAEALQSSILNIANMSENERDGLIKKHLVSIVGHLFSLASCSSDPAAPYYTKDAIIQSVQTVVDGFMDTGDHPSTAGVIDKINIFRPDRVFMFLVDIHYKVTAAMHNRHKCHRLAGIEVLVHIIGNRAAVPSTYNYLFKLVGQYINNSDLQGQCCQIISTALQAPNDAQSQQNLAVLGEQLQILVSVLVECCIPNEPREEISTEQLSPVLSLLRQLTVDSHSSIHEYVKELEPFPELCIFEEIRRFHKRLSQVSTPRDQFIKFVKRSSSLPPKLLLWSLRKLHKKLLTGEILQNNDGGSFGSSDNEVVRAVWELVPLCATCNSVAVTSLVSDFLSRVGIGDPHCVVFHLPGDSSHLLVRRPIDYGSAVGTYGHLNVTLSEERLVAIVRLLKKYLIDDSAKVIDMASQALRGILSTERGQRALLSFDTYERSIIEVHAKGIDTELVGSLLLELERKFDAEGVSLEKSALWMTDDKSFEAWICPLVYSLTGFCSETILRFCQDLVVLKAELAELLLPCVFINLARQDDLNVNIQKLITSQLQDNIFVESNMLTKSIQVMLDVLNELRVLHVTEKTASYSTSRDAAKCSKISSYGSKSRSAPSKLKELTSPSVDMTPSTSLWHKVYWLSLDYLVVAKSAIRCGSYFTSVMYLEYWCEEHSNSLTLGNPDFSPDETLPSHIEMLVSALTQINEPDSLNGIIQSHKLTSQIITFEHEGNWNKALEYYDLQVRFNTSGLNGSSNMQQEHVQPRSNEPVSITDNEMCQRKAYKGLVRSLQQVGCTHVLDLYCQGLTSRNSEFHQDLEFIELQYEAAWRAGNWDVSFLAIGGSPSQHTRIDHFNESLYSCLRALQEGDFKEFHSKLECSKLDLVRSVHHASTESTEYIYSTIVKLQMFDHLGTAWNLRWAPSSPDSVEYSSTKQRVSYEPVLPAMHELLPLDGVWNNILKQAQLHMSLLEPFIAFRKVLLQILNCKEGMVHHLLQAASTLRKGSKFSYAAGALQELKFLCSHAREDHTTTYWLARLEEAKLLRAQGRHEMAINLAKYIAETYQLNEDVSNVFRLAGKWLAETRASNSRTILEKYLKQSVSLAESCRNTDTKFILRQTQSQFHLAHYADALFRSYEERLSSNEWQAAMRLRKHKTVELEALVRRLKSSSKGDKTDLSIKIQELQKQLAMDREEAQRLQDDRDKFLNLALEGYGRCLVIGDKYDVRGVFRLVSLWFSLSSRQNVVDSMLGTINAVQSYKFIPLAYQIASRIGSSKDGAGPHSFQFAVFSLVKKMAIDHPYHTIFQLLALANGDRIKDKQRSKNSFVVDMDKKVAAENLLKELASHHGAIIKQMRQMVEVYIRLAELETRREDTNKRVALPRDIRSVRQLELVPVVTSSFPVDRSCLYHEGSFPHFVGLVDSVMVMNGINAPKVVECLGSDGRKYRQLAKSGNDDLRQDAVMEQFFDLVNTFLQNNRDTQKRRLGIRTYKVVPFTPSAGVLEWVDGTLPLGEYLIGSSRNGGAHVRYGEGDWSFAKCREHMANAKDKRKAFQEVTENFRPVMHHFFLERFSLPADWFEKRLAYTRSVASSSMVGYIVGLGDRHSMNILIDQATAEVVHIDLGVAFEQGLMLKTPERVPFRLTRDIIDGMGVTGVEGVFRRCCEETLSVMRTNKEALLTIVEVFIHDPLYKWALSPLKALQRQKEKEEDLVTCLDNSEDEYEGNKDAARALMRVKQKLDGYEDGEMRSVHGQVQQLIQDAIDPERLSQMFPGWGAWL